MIKINDILIERKYFPDGTQRLLTIDIFPNKIVTDEAYYNFYWKYENDEELVTIMFLVKHLRNNDPTCRMTLYMPFIPNSRMDRVKSTKEVFTLKWFCEIINSLEFINVCVYDPHSSVSEGLINHINVLEERLDLSLAYTISKTNECNLIYFPDAGALKRYGDMPSLKKFPKVYGKKNRDWKTGEIKGLSILSDDGEVSELVKDANILMVDDIISYGGTLFYSALELKKLGAKTINAYVSHTENSVLDVEKGKFRKLLEDGTVSYLYTTSSIYNGIHPKIKLID